MYCLYPRVSRCVAASCVSGSRTGSTRLDLARVSLLLALALQLPDAAQMSTPSKSPSDGPFRRLVRSLSRSSPRSERPGGNQTPASPQSPPALPSPPLNNKRYDDMIRYAPATSTTPRLESPPASAALSTSPPPGELCSFRSLWGEQRKRSGRGTGSDGAASPEALSCCMQLEIQVHRVLRGSATSRGRTGSERGARSSGPSSSEAAAAGLD